MAKRGRPPIIIGITLAGEVVFWIGLIVGLPVVTFRKLKREQCRMSTRAYQVQRTLLVSLMVQVRQGKEQLVSSSRKHKIRKFLLQFKNDPDHAFPYGLWFTFTVLGAAYMPKKRDIPSGDSAHVDVPFKAMEKTMV